MTTGQARFVHYYTEQNDRHRGRDWRGGPGFPYAWFDIEIFCGLLIDDLHSAEQRPLRLAHEFDNLRYLRRTRGWLTLDTWRQLVRTLPTLVANLRGKPSRRRYLRDLRRIETEARDWLAQCIKCGRFTGVGESDRLAFGRWYDGIMGRANDRSTDRRAWVCLQRHISEAYRRGPRACLAQSAEAAALVPAEWLKHQQWQLAIHLSGHGGRRIAHQLLGSREFVRSSGRDASKVPLSDLIPLMQFDSQEGLDWLWGDVGNITYLIRRADLLAMDFSNVVVKLND